jgi:TP901 family phage tail tape measure protein
MALDTGHSLYWKTGIDNQGLKKGSTEAKGILRTLSKSVTGMDIFAGLGISATIAFTKMSKEAYDFSKEFESAMKEVQTISETVQKNYAGVSKEIIEMTKTVPENAKNLAKGLYQIVSAGYDGAESMDILRQSAELAVAGVTDTFTAADAITSIMNAYGEAAGNAENISDKLFTTVKLGKTSMRELGPEITTVTGLAAQAGLAFDDLMAIIAQGVKTLKTPEMMTGLRGMLTAIIKPTTEAEKVIEDLGIQFDVAAIKTKGFKAFLTDVMEATNGNIEVLSELFPNVRGLAGLLSVATEEGEAFNQALEAMENSAGATTEAFKTMMDSTENQLAILHNNVMAKLKPIGDSMLSFMNNIARGINDVMTGAKDSFTDLQRSYVELTDALESRKSRIDDLILTIEGLRKKTELTKDESVELKAAEEALATYFPHLKSAAEGAAGGIDILNIAKQESYNLSVRIMELELEQAKIDKIRAEIALKEYQLQEDRSQKEIERLELQMKYRKQDIKDSMSILEMAKTTNEEMEKILESDTEYLKLQNELSIATEGRSLQERQLHLDLEKSTHEVDALTESLEELKKAGEQKITPKVDIGADTDVDTGGGGGTGADIVASDDMAKEVEANLKEMAARYKQYLADVKQFGYEYVKEHNSQLVKDGENYRQYLEDMRSKYSGHAELSKAIEEDIYDYNKIIEEKRRKIEEEHFAYIAEEREKELQAEKDKFDKLIIEYQEGSEEYLQIVEQHKQKELEINERYDKRIAEEKLAMFKVEYARPEDILDVNYKKRLEDAREALGEETKYNKLLFEYIKEELDAIAKAEEDLYKEKRKSLESYLQAYRTTEEKITSINKKTADLMEVADKEYERDKLKSIETQLIAEIKFSEAKQKINDKRAEYGKELNNKELEDYIEYLEEMLAEYAKYTDSIILLDEEIAESQKQIWENVRSEIDSTASALHNLADIVGNFDTELESMINDLANLVSGVGVIMSGFTMGGIGGIATALGGIATVISSIINLFVQHKSEVPELEEELHDITLELQAQQNILNQATGTAETEAIKDRIALLKEQIDIYYDLIEAEEAAYGQFLWWTWDETNQEAIDNYLSSIQNVNAEIANLNQQYQQILTGTTAETIADAIADGFEQGLDSAQVFADTFNDMMEKAMIDAFKRSILTRYLERWYGWFAGLSEGGLTPDEISHLAEMYQYIIEQAESEWQAIQDIASQIGLQLTDVSENLEDADNITGLTGAIAGITEETAGLLAGQFQAIRINTVGILNNMESIIIINSQIAEHTSYNRYLENIWNKINTSGSLESETLRGIGGV